jgi:hypothetical protein
MIWYFLDPSLHTPCQPISTWPEGYVLYWILQCGVKPLEMELLKLMYIPNPDAHPLVDAT